MKHILTIVILFTLIVGCTPKSTVTQMATFAPFTSTLTPLPLTVMPSATVKPTSTPNPYLTVKCLEVLAELPLNAQLQGTLVLGTYYGKTNQSYLLNLQTGEKIPLRGRDDEFLEAFSISPDSHWLAYTSMRTKATWTDRLVIMGADGKPIKDRLVSTREWIYMDGWVNNQNLIFAKYDRVNYSRYGGPLAAVVYNPFTTEQKQLDPDYPDIEIDGNRLFGWSYTETVYDPTLSLVVYPRSDRETVILWDRESNREIVRFSRRLFNAEGAIPVWSPDGSVMLKLDTPENADPSQVELFGMSRGGTLTQLTYLTNSSPNAWVSSFSWSPDMRHIAFWLSLGPDNGENLAVLDLETKTVTNYCLKGLTHWRNMSGLLSAPIWSPDSNKLLINLPNGEDNSKAVIIDIDQDYAAEIVDNMLPIGWLTNEP